MKLKAKAYGKVLVFGAYSILEPGHVGLVVNINKGTTTTAEEVSGGRIAIDLANFEISVYGEMQDGKLVLKKDSETIKFIKNAVQCAFSYLNSQRIHLKDLKLVSYNDPEFFITREIKGGFGSSATSSVSAIAAVLGVHGVRDRDTVFKIASYAHYKSQGNIGSGFDILAACYGSNFFLSEPIKITDDFTEHMNSNFSILKEEYMWPQNLMPLIVSTGKSASTPELVRKVMLFKQKKPQEYSNIINKYNYINLRLKKAFESGDPVNIKDLLEKSWEQRKILGDMAGAPIEPQKYTELIRSMKQNGAFTAGLAGAGGGDSILALCTSTHDKGRLISFLEKNKMYVFDDVSLIDQPFDIDEN